MTSYLSGITDFISAHPQYAAWTVFLLAFSEAIPIVGTVVPGSTLIVAISALAMSRDLGGAGSARPAARSEGARARSSRA